MPELRHFLVSETIDHQSELLPGSIRSIIDSEMSAIAATLRKAFSYRKEGGNANATDCLAPCNTYFRTSASIYRHELRLWVGDDELNINPRRTPTPNATGRTVAGARLTESPNES